MTRRYAILLFSITLAIGLTAFLVIPRLTLAQGGDLASILRSEIAAPQQEGAPSVVSYQGQVTVGGSPYSGSGHFKFAIVNQAGDQSFWSNDGTSSAGSEPSQGVPLPVANGLFMVLLGDTSLTNMSQALGASVFSGPNRYLRVWFSSDGSSYQQLSPDQRIAAVPYALQAEKVQGYAGVVVVAKSGGDFTDIQQAVDSISDAGEDNPYLVWVAPGIYEGAVSLTPYIHLQGAGQETTIISSTVSSSDDPPTAATIVLADETSLRDLTVKNSGNGNHNVGVLLHQENQSAELSRVTVESWSNGSGYTYGIYAGGSFNSLVCHAVRAEAVSSGQSYGLFSDTSNVQLFGGQFTGRFGENAYGIYHQGGELVADGVDAEARNGNINFGLYNTGWRVRWQGGSIEVKGGGDTWGIYNTGSNTQIRIFDVDVYSEGSLLVASPSDYVTALLNRDGATAMLSGGRYSAYGGSEQTRGIYNVGTDTTLETHNVAVEGGAGSTYNLVYGLFNDAGAEAVLNGGSFIASGGTSTRGILNRDEDTTLDAIGITVEGRDGSSQDRGLINQYDASVDANNSIFIGNPAIYASTGTIRLMASQIDGGAVRTTGSLTCIYVIDGNYNSYTCP